MKTTKEAIRKTAQRLFQEKGFLNVSVEDICAELGITKGSFYHHYKSKYEPFLDAIREKATNPEEFLSSITDIPSPREQLWQLYKWMYYEQTKDLSREDYRVLWLFFMEGSMFGIATFSQERFPGLENYLRKTIAEAQERGEIRNSRPAQEIIDLLIYAALGYTTEWTNGMLQGSYLDGLQKTFDSALG